MKPVTLRFKIHLIVGTLTVLFVLALFGLEWRGMRESVREEVVAAHRVATQLLQRNALLYGVQGMPVILAYLEGIGRIRSNDVVLLDDQDRELYRSPPSSYKAGRDAPAWFARLVSPTPSVQLIVFPGGRLVTTTNASRAVIDAWDDMTVLATVSATLLLIANLLTFWLVGRALRPLGQIVGALEALGAGRFDAALPPLPGAEAALIGATFNRMLAGLRHTMDTERRAAQAESRLSDNRELTRWIEGQLERERRLIARELHDELGQSVTAMHSMALSIAKRVGAVDSESERAARVIADESSRLYEAMHGIIPRLTPLVLDNFGLAEALAELVERLRRSQPAVVIELQVDLAGSVLASDASLALYRGAQEAVTNALRHGHAAHVRIALNGDADRAVLTVTDDGDGFPAPPTPSKDHHGLRWIAERVEGLGGTLEISARAASDPALKGVRLEVRLPLTDGASAREPQAVPG